MDITTWLVIGVITGAIGMGYFVYGKKQQLLVPMLAGAALCVYPYFTSNVWVTILIAGSRWRHHSSCGGEQRPRRFPRL